MHGQAGRFGYSRRGLFETAISRYIAILGPWFRGKLFPIGGPKQKSVAIKSIEWPASECHSLSGFHLTNAKTEKPPAVYSSTKATENESRHHTMSTMRSPGLAGAAVLRAMRTRGRSRVASSAQPREAAANRLLTIFFSDIVSPTYLTDPTGAEPFRDILRDYRERAANCCHKYGEFITRFLGDGTLVYFSYPGAHEDDALRAVRASLEVGSAVKDLGSLLPARP